MHFNPNLLILANSTMTFVSFCNSRHGQIFRSLFLSNLTMNFVSFCHQIVLNANVDTPLQQKWSEKCYPATDTSATVIRKLTMSRIVKTNKGHGRIYQNQRVGIKMQIWWNVIVFFVIIPFFNEIIENILTLKIKYNQRSTDL